ncbi:ScyD/ScyE family protein [Spirosoma sp. BT702]|uniref:ScyD/ScyE family protein n=1 Tax=Spirosoma profusum TaxID=2771354 RepID=A0A926Y3T8_9BACT|nr:ScyD/ScyE family protein [Spirosoma profusum]MBD2704477.1 ScyD/ScyE family protein [Spirosoma profusum]
MFKKRSTLYSLLPMLLIGSCLLVVVSCLDHRIPNPLTLAPVAGPPFASGLRSPIGLTDDPRGNVWVTEAGSGTINNGQVTVITPAGVKYPAITGFVSAISPEGSPEGLTHLTYKDGKLYILNGVQEQLFVADISNFVPGVSPPIPASSLLGIDIGTFVRTARPNAPDAPDSNPYNLTFGPNGDLFIVDAGGNAIIRRNQTSGALSVFAVFNDIPNSTTVGPPMVDAVPTGIVYDGTNFYVSTLTGAPFPAGAARIYQVNANGTAPVTPTIYKTGFSGLTDITLAPSRLPLVTEFGFGPPGRVANEAGATLVSPVITAVDIHPSTTSLDTYYVLSYGPGIITKFTAQ